VTSNLYITYKYNRIHVAQRNHVWFSVYEVSVFLSKVCDIEGSDVSDWETVEKRENKAVGNNDFPRYRNDNWTHKSFRVS